MSKHWPRLAEFGQSDAYVPWDARGLKPKIVQTPGRTQEQEDTLAQENLDKQRGVLDEREASLKKATLAGIERTKEKTPRREATTVKVKRNERKTGLRF